MEGLVLEYRDPLFGIVIFFSLIFCISFLTYTFGAYKERKARKEYRKLLKRFELGKLKEEDYVHLYKTYNLPFDSIILLASSFLHKGDYTKAISVYLALLEHVTNRVKKEELLELLGTTYYKGGFLQRSKDIFLKILKFSPRNTSALQYLLLIYEKLKDFDRAFEVLESLDELQIDISKDKIYIKTLKVIHDPLLSYEKKTHALLDIFKKDKIIERLFAQYLIMYNKTFLWENIDSFDVNKFTDLMWYQRFEDIDFDKVNNNPFLEELYNAKSYLNSLKHSKDFDLDILILLNTHEHDTKADLDFEFICTSCKHVHPIFESRCPHCHSILSFIVKHMLVKNAYEKNQSLL